MTPDAMDPPVEPEGQRRDEVRDWNSSCPACPLHACSLALLAPLRTPSPLPRSLRLDRRVYASN